MSRVLHRSCIANACPVLLSIDLDLPLSLPGSVWCFRLFWRRKPRDWYSSHSYNSRMSHIHGNNFALFLRGISMRRIPCSYTTFYLQGQSSHCTSLHPFPHSATWLLPVEIPRHPSRHGKHSRLHSRSRTSTKGNDHTWLIDQAFNMRARRPEINA